jgi:hypothetical protein
MKRKTVKPLDLSTPEAPETGPAPEDVFAAPYAEPDSDLDMEPSPKEAPPVAEADPEPPLTMGVAESAEAPPARAELPPLPVRRDLPPQPVAPKGGGRGIYALALVISIVWAAGPIAFFSGYTRNIQPFDYEPFAITVFALLAAGPIALVWVAAFLLNQGARLAAEARFARAQAEDMIRPAAIAAAGAGGAAEMIRGQIEHAVAAAAQARHELATLREVLAAESATLIEAAEHSARTANALTTSLGFERTELITLSANLEGQVASVEDAIVRQARLVSEASDLAETQIREAEAQLAAGAANLSVAAGDATDAARTAAEDLARQAARLEAAGTGVTEQIRTVEDSLAEQRAALVSVALSLRTEQEDFAAQVESQQAQLSEVLAMVRAEAGDLGAAALQGGEAVEALVAKAVDQVREVAEAAAEERDHFSAASLQSLGALAEAARHERAVLEDEAQNAIEALSRAAADARAATESQTESARQRIDQLSEAAFAAGQKADTAFEARLNEARALIEQSASLVEEAGARAGERLVNGLEAARRTVEQLEGLLAEVDARTARLPADAHARGQEVKAVVEQGVEELLTAARRAADETQAIDAAFQERVHRNYEMLSEAVRLMGVVSGPATARPARAASLRHFTPSTLSPRALRPSQTAEAAETPPPAAEEAPARTRLKLKPTPATGDEALFDEPASSERTAADDFDGDDWTWKELLAEVDDGAPPAPAAAPDTDTPRLLSQITALGIDPAALLPRTRLEEIVAVLREGDQAAARDVVRRLAPAAMRRMSRRVLTDTPLRTQASHFLKRFEIELDEAAAEHGDEGLMELIASDEGRAFLLLDAALGELG